MGGQRDSAAPGVLVFDLWERDEHRLLVGVVFVGLGCLLGLGLRCFGEPGEPAPGLWMACFFTALGVIPGVFFLTLRRLVELDAKNRRLTRKALLLGRQVKQHSWSFNDLAAVRLRHQATGDDTYTALVGIHPLEGAVIWMRSFRAAADTPGQDATLFAHSLASMTGLPVETESR